MGVDSLHLYFVQVGSGDHQAFNPMSATVKWPESEDDQRLPTSTKVKNAWSYISIPPYVLKLL
jgi:hypothetical protein